MFKVLSNRSFQLLILPVLCIVCQSCENRFGNTPVYDLDTADEPLNESLIVSERDLKAFEKDELIQYLKLHEEADWKNTSVGEVEKILLNFNDNSELLELASDFYLKRGDLDKALLYNTQAENHGAESTEFYKKRADICMAFGQYGLAIDYINKAVMINGNDPDIYLSKGEVYMEFGDSISALKYMEQAFGYDSSRLDVAYDLAFLYAAAGQDIKARSFADWLIGLAYHARELNYLRAELYRRENKEVAANQVLSSMLSSGEIAAGESLLDYFHQQNQYDSMLYYAMQILNQDSLNMMAIAAKAVSFDHKGYFSSALMYYNQMLVIDSLNKEAVEGIRKVNGKIAYLRKLREQREAIPTFDFASPRKETN